MKSVNPFSLKFLGEYPEHSAEEFFQRINLCSATQNIWNYNSFSERNRLFNNLAQNLEDNVEYYASIITAEMGKLLKESVAEIKKCAWVCRFYAENGELFLEPEPIATEAAESKIIFQPLGVILGIMPWNYPFWQVFRFAVPTIMAGNGVILKHSPNVQGCAEAIEKIFREAGFPEGLLCNIHVSVSDTETIITNDKIKGVSLTGSEQAGRSVATLAGKYLKPCILELGGSDAFIVFEDADLPKAAKTGYVSRMLTSGQTCISAKRFIIQKSISEEFMQMLIAEIKQSIAGDPSAPITTLAPLAEMRFVEKIHKQVRSSVEKGASVIEGGQFAARNGSFYPITLVSRAMPGMELFDDETFGPVCSITTFSNDEEALSLANNSRFGLGASVWTKDSNRQNFFIHNLEVGAVFINEMVKSDPRLPFGGIKNSGYGRELGKEGIRAFTNIKTVWRV